jgi:isocitrate dehydrogenase kinase/phosphatase
MGAEPWYHVAENDVFPEEFMTFLGLPARLQAIFRAAHGDLLDVRFWQSMQARHRAGEAVDILPYRESERLKP